MAGWRHDGRDGGDTVGFRVEDDCPTFTRQRAGYRPHVDVKMDYPERASGTLENASPEQLRDLADWLEANKNVPVFGSVAIERFDVSALGLNTRSKDVPWPDGVYLVWFGKHSHEDERGYNDPQHRDIRLIRWIRGKANDDVGVHKQPSGDYFLSRIVYISPRIEVDE